MSSRVVQSVLNACALISLLAIVGNAQQPPASPRNESTASNAADFEDVRKQLAEQKREIEQMRALLDAQTRVIEELSGRLDQTQRVLTSAPSPATVVKTASLSTGESASISSSASTGTTQSDDRLKRVEEQAKATADTVKRQLGSLTFSGDLRLRWESFYGLQNGQANAANPGVLGNDLNTRQRMRIRARFAIRGRISPELEWGLRLATGSTSDAISTNQTLTDFFNRKPFSLDQAFVAWSPKRVPGLKLQGGKFETPWTSTEMTIDSDVQVEGFSQSYTRSFKKSTLKNLTFTAWELPILERNSAFIRNSIGTVNLSETARAGRDLALYGGQIRARFEPSSNVAITASVADLYFSGTQFISPVQFFGNQVQLPITITIPATATTPAQTVTTQATIARDLLVAGNGNLGFVNATTNATNRDGRLASGYNLIDVIGRLDLTYSKRWPVAIVFDFVRNTQTHDVIVAGANGQNVFLKNNENTGFWLEIQAGRTRERGDILLGYTFARIEKDAVLTPFNFSDFGSASDVRAHRFNFQYAADPRVIFAITGIVSGRPNGHLGPFGINPLGSFNRPNTRLQIDTIFRF